MLKVSNRGMTESALCVSTHGQAFYFVYVNMQRYYFVVPISTT